MDKVGRGITFGGVIISNSPLLIYTVSYLSGILIGSNYPFSAQTAFLLSATSSILTFFIYYFCFKLKSSLLDFSVFLFSIISFISLGWFNICESQYGSVSIENSKLLNKNEINEAMTLYLDSKVSILEAGDTIFTVLKPVRFTNFKGSKFDYARKRYIDEIFRLIGHGNEAAIMVAITIGEKSYLNKDIKKAFSNSGTMHLLAVSGLHVGFIYMFLTFFLLILGNYKKSIIVRFIIITLSLWFFAAIAGFVPSITRAVIMTTVYEICKILERRRIGLNTLSLSALIITIFDPDAIFDLGFQLSYTALLSIIVIHPRINYYYNPKNIIAKYIWTIVSISLACQIGTSLITVTHFGFLPTYFLLSNLLAIPLSAIILYLSMGQLAFLGNDAITDIITNILRFLIKLLTDTLTRIESLPFPTISLSLNEGQIISILMLIIIYSINITEDRIFKRYISLGLVISFIVCSL